MTAPTPAVVPPRRPRLLAFTFGVSLPERRGGALRCAQRDVERLHRALNAVVADSTEVDIDLTIEAYRRARARAIDSLRMLDSLLTDPAGTPVPTPTARGGAS